MCIRELLQEQPRHRLASVMRLDCPGTGVQPAAAMDDGQGRGVTKQGNAVQYDLSIPPGILHSFNPSLLCATTALGSEASAVNLEAKQISVWCVEPTGDRRSTNSPLCHGGKDVKRRSGQGQGIWGHL